GARDTAANTLTGYLCGAGAAFVGNSAPAGTLLSGYGGAVAAEGVHTFMTSVSFQQNQGRFGGAVFVGNGKGAINASIDHATFDHNASGSWGGGLYTNTGATLSVTSTAFTNNQATGAGGAVARFAAKLTLTDTSLTNNTAGQVGGGLYNDSGPTGAEGGYTEIHDSTIAANTAPSGGGLYNNAEANLQNVTVLNNTGGLYQASGTAITRASDSVWQNPNSSNCAGTGAVSSAGGNFATDTTCGLTTTTTDRQGTGLNAQLGTLTNDGPNTTWYALPLAGSPLINAAVPTCSTTDQRHASRPDACDIGAVEFGGVL
ncbi:choice-of-anchor Q domain-containing protein, partial [Streptomyces sp. NPDC059627]